MPDLTNTLIDIAASALPESDKFCERYATDHQPVREQRTYEIDYGLSVQYEYVKETDAAHGSVNEWVVLMGVEIFGVYTTLDSHEQHMQHWLLWQVEMHEGVR